jgi:hypothetical protein
VEQHPDTYNSIYEGAWFLEEEFQEFKKELFKKQLDIPRVRDELLDFLMVGFRLLIDNLKFEDIVPTLD